jgi:hypothetical protein
MNQYQLRGATPNKDTNSSDSPPVKSDINESTTSDETSEKEVSFMNGILPGKDLDVTLTHFFDVTERFRKNLENGSAKSAYLNTLEIQRVIDLIQRTHFVVKEHTVNEILNDNTTGLFRGY